MHSVYLFNLWCKASNIKKCFAALRQGATCIVSGLSHTPCTKVYVLTSVANPSLLYLCIYEAGKLAIAIECGAVCSAVHHGL